MVKAGAFQTVSVLVFRFPVFRLMAQSFHYSDL
jgi:hypothetical protein